MSVGGILLAAGASTRMGFPKQLLELAGKTLVRRATDALLATGCDPVVVVLGANADRIVPHLNGMPVITVVNEDWKSGMGSTIRTGLKVFLQSNSNRDAALITLCDQPLITDGDLLSLIELYNASGKPIAAAAYGETAGVPAIFASSLFPALLALKGETGARKIILEKMGNVAQLPLPHAALDVDRRSDLAAAGITLAACD